MSIFSRWLLVIFLTALFVGAGLVGGPANEGEAALMRSIAAVRTDWPMLTGVMAGLTRLGGAPVTLGLAAAASLWLLLRHAPARALLVALAVIIERLLVEQLKAWVGRPRPQFELDWLPQSLAYPSGHAANSMTTFLAVALIAAPPGLRRTAVVAAVSLSVLVGVTRVYLGVHWPSDVIGGWALGLLSVLAALAVGGRSGVRGLEAKHEIVGRHRPPLGEDKAA